jgi:hypothetical protein
MNKLHVGRVGKIKMRSSFSPEWAKPARSQNERHFLDQSDLAGEFNEE